MAAPKFYTSTTRANTEIKKLRASKARLRKEVKDAPMSDALQNFAAIQAGAAGAGALQSAVGSEIMGIPSSPMVGGLLAVGGYFTGTTLAVYAAAGMIAPYISELTQDMLEK